MVERTRCDLDRIFRALADPSRREMLRSLAIHERTVSELAQPCRMSLAAASKHIKSLERAGLVRRTVQGRTHICRLEPAPLAEAHAWLVYYEHFWKERLGSLENLLREMDREP